MPFISDLWHPWEKDNSHDDLILHEKHTFDHISRKLSCIYSGVLGRHFLRMKKQRDIWARSSVTAVIPRSANDNFVKKSTLNYLLDWNISWNKYQASLHTKWRSLELLRETINNRVIGFWEEHWWLGHPRLEKLGRDGIETEKIRNSFFPSIIVVWSTIHCSVKNSFDLLDFHRYWAISMRSNSIDLFIKSKLFYWFNNS